MNKYVRAKFSGTLKLLTDMHIGDGEFVKLESHQTRGIELSTNQSVVSCCTRFNMPYIPASTLRGALLANVDRRDISCREESMARELFGYAEYTPDLPAQSKRMASKVRFYNATWKSAPNQASTLPLWSEQRKTFVRYHNAIDKMTKTAKHGALFAMELVPALSTFDWHIEADDLTEKQLISLQQIFKCVNSFQKLFLGADKNNFSGESELYLTCSQVCSLDDWRNWIKSNLENSSLPITNMPMKPWIPDMAQHAAPSHMALKPQRAENIYSASLIMTSPFLVNDPGIVKKSNPERNIFHPKNCYMRTHKNALVPASSLKGVLRAQASWIIASICHHHYACPPTEATLIAKNVTDLLFGNTTHRGAIGVSDFKGEITDSLVQPHVAIDRHTGGAIDEKLFLTESAQCHTLSGRLKIEWWKLEKHTYARGIILLLLKDWFEGKLKIGADSAEGKGGFYLSKLACNCTHNDNKEFACGKNNNIQANEKNIADIVALHTHLKNEVDRFYNSCAANP